MIRCICSHCSNPLEVSEHYANAKIACKNCRAIVRIPAAGAGPDTPAEVVTPPPAPPPGVEAAPRPAARPAPAPPRGPGVKPTPASAPGSMPRPAPAAPPQPAVVKKPGSGPGTTPKPPPASAPRPAAVKPTPGSGPGTTPKPPPAGAQHPKAPAAQAAGPHQETIVPTLMMVEAVRFGCTLCGGVVLAWPSQIGGLAECPACKGQTPVPAPHEGHTDGAAGAIKPAGKSAPGTAPKPIPGAAPGAAPKPPVAPARGQARPAPAAAPRAAAAPAPIKSVKPGAARPFRFPCPHCHAPITADVYQVGLMMLCPKCKQNVSVPEPAPASS